MGEPVDLNLLRRKAIIEFGLSPEDSICQDIERLNETHNEALFRRVQIALANLEASRNAMPHSSDRMPPPQAFQGELEVARVPTPYGTVTPVRIKPSRLTTHSIYAGLPGVGKTFLCRLLLGLLFLVAPHVRILLFDPNRSYLEACSDPRRWLFIPWHGVRMNPLVPPAGYPERSWLSEKVDLFCRGELIASRWLLANRLDSVMTEARSRATSSGFLYPSLVDVRENLLHTKCYGYRERQYWEALVNVIDGRLRTTGDVYDCASGMEPKLVDTRARVSTEGLSQLQNLDFFITNLIHYVCRLRAVAPLVEPPELHTLVVIEEAQSLLEPRGGGVAFYQELLLRARALGVGFLFITQDLSRIDPLVAAACNNFFIFAQSSSDNKRTCQATLDLSSRETAMLGELEPGECFIRFVGHPGFPFPFLARIPAHA